MNYTNKLLSAISFAQSKLYQPERFDISIEFLAGLREELHDHGFPSDESFSLPFVGWFCGIRIFVDPNMTGYRYRLITHEIDYAQILKDNLDKMD